jgi:hypothetical protein
MPYGADCPWAVAYPYYEDSTCPCPIPLARSLADATTWAEEYAEAWVAGAIPVVLGRGDFVPDRWDDEHADQGVHTYG